MRKYRVKSDRRWRTDGRTDSRPENISLSPPSVGAEAKTNSYWWNWLLPSSLYDIVIKKLYIRTQNCVRKLRIVQLFGFSVVLLAFEEKISNFSRCWVRTVIWYDTMQCAFEGPRSSQRSLTRDIEKSWSNKK